MKKILLLATAITALTLPSVADVYTFSGPFANSGIVPDYPASGWSDMQTLSGISGVISDVNVMLNISGGWNGDLYGYLRFVPTGGSSIYFATLLNRVGVGEIDGGPYGYSTAGFPTIWLDDAAAANIHGVQSPGTGLSYQPDGGLLSTFNNLTANGDWTLFLADKSTGDQSTVVDWALDISITAVPEPGVWPVAVLIALVAGVKLNQHIRRRKTA